MVNKKKDKELKKLEEYKKKLQDEESPDFEFPTKTKPEIQFPIKERKDSRTSIEHHKETSRMSIIWDSIKEFEERGRNCGNSAHVRVPKAWIGKLIKVQLIEE